MAIVREKELGTLEQLNVTRSSAGAHRGKLLPFGLIGIVDVILVVSVAVLWFEIPAARELPAALRSVARLPAVHTQPGTARVHGVPQPAAGDDDGRLLLHDADDLPVGVHLPIENMPAVIEPITYLIPLRYYLVIVRGIFLKGLAWSRSERRPAHARMGPHRADACDDEVEEDADIGERRNIVCR